MRNYIGEYKVKKLQAGGMPAEAPMEQGPPQGGGGDPVMELMQAGMQALETQDCETGFQVLAAMLELIGGAMQGEGGAPPAMEMGGPVIYKKGGKISAVVTDASQLGLDKDSITPTSKKFKKGSRVKASYGAKKPKKKVIK